MISYDVLTVVRDPRFPLGKQFTIDAGGKIVKTTAVAVSIGLAVQHHVADIATLQALLSMVSEDSHAAIINAAFPRVPLDTEFLIFSEKEFMIRGIDRHDSSVSWPVTLPYRDAEYLALGRFTEHTAPSSWLLLDRDVDEHTPKHYASLDYEAWLAEVNKLLPGIADCARLHARSSSSRVSVGGAPVGGGNGHTWVQLVDAGDAERLRRVVKARAIALGMSWTKPRISRDTGEEVGRDVATIIDWSVFTHGRLIFAGRPVVQP
ncbi:MAG: hypothetical protein HS110_10475 [Zoogloeaceae bacterium]|nr:hypothetical protein [Zoogloeaceae bacterium]MCK6385245.1 hypothetical protein [Rhodocyclaceae bacterium]